MRRGARRPGPLPRERLDRIRAGVTHPMTPNAHRPTEANPMPSKILTVAKQIVAAVTPSATAAPRPKRKDPWLTAEPRARATRPHPHQALLDAIDEAHRGRRRWLPRRHGW